MPALTPEQVAELNALAKDGKLVEARALRDQYMRASAPPVVVKAPVKAAPKARVQPAQPVKALTPPPVAPVPQPAAVEQKKVVPKEALGIRPPTESSAHTALWLQRQPAIAGRRTALIQGGASYEDADREATAAVDKLLTGGRDLAGDLVNVNAGIMPEYAKTTGAPVGSPVQKTAFGIAKALLPQQIGTTKEREGERFDAGRIGKRVFTEATDKQGRIFESLPATAFRDLSSMWQFVYEPVQQALTYDMDAKGKVLDKSDYAYQIEQALPDFYTNDPNATPSPTPAGTPAALDRVAAFAVAGPGALLPRPFQARTVREGEVRANGVLSAIDRASESVARGEFLGSTLSKMPQYTKEWEDAGAPWVPYAVGLGGELVNPYLSPAGALFDVGKGGARLASGAARAGGHLRTATALEHVGDLSKAIDRANASREATRVTMGADVAKDVAPEYRKAMELDSARNVIASKLADEVIPLAALHERAIDSNGAFNAEHAQTAASQMAHHPAVEKIVTQSYVNGKFDAAALDRNLRAWQARVQANGSPQVQQLYALGRRAGENYSLDTVLKQGKQYISEHMLNAVPGDLIFVTPTVVSRAKVLEKYLGPLSTKMQELTKDVRFANGMVEGIYAHPISFMDYTRWFNARKSEEYLKLAGDGATELSFTGNAATRAARPVERRIPGFDALVDERVKGDVRRTPLKVANELEALRGSLVQVPDEVIAELKANPGEAGLNTLLAKASEKDTLGAWNRVLTSYFGRAHQFEPKVFETLVGGRPLTVQNFETVSAEMLKLRPDLGANLPKSAAGRRYPFAAMAAYLVESRAAEKIVAGYEDLARAHPEFAVGNYEGDFIKLVKEAIGAKLASGDIDATNFGNFRGYEDLDKYIGVNEMAKEMLLHWGAHEGRTLTSTGAVPALVDLDKDTAMFFGLDTAEELEKFRAGARTGQLQRNLDTLRLNGDRASWGYANKALGDMNRLMVGGMLGGNVLPNMRFHGTNFLTAPFIVATTVGQKNALGAMGRMFDWQALKRVKAPEDVMFTAKDGRAWTKAEIEASIKQANIGQSQAGFEFGPAIIADMKRVGNVGISGKTRGFMAKALDKATPNLATKGAWSKLAERSDVLWRESVYVHALKEGRTEAEAAKLAQESMLDYGAIPAGERDTIARWFLFYSFQRQMTKEALQALAKDPGVFRRVLKTQQAMSDQAFDDTVALTDPYISRLAYYGGDVYDGAKKTFFVGPDVPPLAALRDILQVVDWAGSGGSIQEAAETLKDRGTTPTISLILETSRYAPENKDTGRIDPHIVAALQSSGAWPAFVEQFGVVSLPTDSRRAGDPTFKGGAAHEGEQYRFGTASGYYKWLAIQWMLTEGGAKRTIDDYTKTLIAAGMAPEGAEMKRLKDGSWALYYMGVLTPVAVPTKVKAQVDNDARVLRELLEMSREADTTATQ